MEFHEGIRKFRCETCGKAFEKVQNVGNVTNMLIVKVFNVLFISWELYNETLNYVICLLTGTRIEQAHIPVSQGD